MVTLKYIRRGNKIYRSRRGNGYWMLWDRNNGYIGNFLSNNTMFEWINEAEKVKQHPSLIIGIPKRALKDIPIGTVSKLNEIKEG